MVGDIILLSTINYYFKGRSYRYMGEVKSLNGMCQSCFMPFKKDPKGADRESVGYCSYCYHDGKLAYEGDDLNEFKKAVYTAMISRGENKYKAKLFTFMVGFAPRWKNKK